MLEIWWSSSSESDESFKWRKKLLIKEDIHSNKENSSVDINEDEPCDVYKIRLGSNKTVISCIFFTRDYLLKTR